jgi:DnaJ-class molecular chaperone
MIAMKHSKPKTGSAEVKCPACDGTGFPAVAQPAKPGRKIFPPACKQCLGKGRVTPT